MSGKLAYGKGPRTLEKFPGAKDREKREQNQRHLQELFNSKDFKEISRFGRAIANPFRYLILITLQKSPRMAGYLTKATSLSQPAVSQHLKILQQAGLVDGYKSGKQITYRLQAGYISKVLNALNGLWK